MAPELDLRAFFVPSHLGSVIDNLWPGFHASMNRPPSPMRRGLLESLLSSRAVRTLVWPN